MALDELANEQLTIDATSGGVGITASLFGAAPPLNILMGVFSVVSGGKIFHSSKATVTGGGTEGSEPENIGAKFEVWGMTDLKAWKAIKQTSESDAKVNVRLFGTG